MFHFPFSPKTIRWNPDLECFFRHDGNEHTTEVLIKKYLREWIVVFWRQVSHSQLLFFGVVIAIFAAVSNKVPCWVYQG